MIARPKISRNEWKPTEIGAFEVGPMSRPFPAPDEAGVEEPKLRREDGGVVREGHRLVRPLPEVPVVDGGPEDVVRGPREKEDLGRANGAFLPPG